MPPRGTMFVSPLDGGERKSYLSAMATQTVKKIIDDRGGFNAVAAALTATFGRRVPKTTVHTWYREDAIPWWHEPAVLAIPKKPKAAPKRRRATA